MSECLPGGDEEDDEEGEVRKATFTVDEGMVWEEERRSCDGAVLSVAKRTNIEVPWYLVSEEAAAAELGECLIKESG